MSEIEDKTNGKICEYANLHLEFDGSCEPKNPGGVACIGWLFKSQDKILVQGHDVVADGGNKATNNFAEYCALGVPLRWLKDQGWQGTLSVTGDSQLIVKQVNEEWKCNKPHLQELRQRVWDLLEELKLDASNFSLEWVPRDLNEAADALGRIAYEKHCKKNKRPARYMFRKKK